MLTLRTYVRIFGRVRAIPPGTHAGDAIELDAPSGFVFAANGCHCIICAYEFTAPPWPERPTLIAGSKGRARNLAMEQLSHGLARCEDPACDVCRDEDECS